MAVVRRARLVQPDPDLALVLKHQAGDADAFALLWRKYEPRLRRFFLRATRSDADADDLASETMLAALGALERYSAHSSGENGPCAVFSTYLYAIARNHLSLWFRRRRRRQEVSLAELMGDCGDEVAPEPGAYEPFGVDPADLILDAHRRDTVCLALASVESDAQFCAVLLHYIAGWSHEDVGRFVGSRSESINNRLQDGRKSLRRCFELLDPEDPPFAH